MTPDELSKLKMLYKKTHSGHTMLSDADFAEYAALRKKEYIDARTELSSRGKRNIRAVKDSAGDIIGIEFQD